MLDIYPDCFEAVADKCEMEGFKSLSEKEKVIYSVWWLEAEVNNGGFFQYFYNTTGDDYQLALDSLEKIGAFHTASILEKAIYVAFEGENPKTQISRQRLLERDEDDKHVQLLELDDLFYEYEEDFLPMMNNFISKQ